MVTEPTVLIVGAGGSIPYWYPSGESLVQRILIGLETLSPKRDPEEVLRPIASLLLHAGYEMSVLIKFRDMLAGSKTYSVDRLLQIKAHHHLLEAGKAAIASALVPHEHSVTLTVQNDWYRYLLNQLISNLGADASEPLTILTYNYDRSLDNYLYASFQTFLGYNGQEMKQLMSRLPIIHIHGSLGKLPWQTDNPADLPTPYGKMQFENPHELKHSAAQIKIIHESEDNSPAYEEARKHLKAASRICFLGFGYDRINVRRLTIESWGSKKAGYIIGSSYGLTDSEKNQRLGFLGGNIVLGSHDLDCLGFLRNNVWVIS